MTSHYRPWFVAVAEAAAGAATAGRSRHHAQGAACLLAAALCLGAWSCAPAVPPGGSSPAVKGTPMQLSEGSLKSEDGFIRAEGNRWTLGTALVEKTISFEGGRLLLRSFRHKAGGREMAPPGSPPEELSAALVGVEGEGTWVLAGGKLVVGLADGQTVALDLK